RTRRPGIGGRILVLSAVEAPPPEKPPHARDDGAEELCDLLIGRRRRRPEPKLSLAALREDALEHEAVKVNVEIGASMRARSPSPLQVSGEERRAQVPHTLPDRDALGVRPRGAVFSD